MTSQLCVLRAESSPSVPMVSSVEWLHRPPWAALLLDKLWREWPAGAGDQGPLPSLATRGGLSEFLGHRLLSVAYRTPPYLRPYNFTGLSCWHQESETFFCACYLSPIWLNAGWLWPNRMGRQSLVELPKRFLQEPSSLSKSSAYFVPESLIIG